KETLRLDPLLSKRERHGTHALRRSRGGPAPRDWVWDVAMYPSCLAHLCEAPRELHSSLSLPSFYSDGQHRPSRCARSTRPRKISATSPWLLASSRWSS